MDIKPRLDETGAKIVAIGNGSAAFAKKFRDGLPFQGDIYLDPEAKTFQALNLRRLSMWEIMTRFLMSFSAIAFSRSISARYQSSDMQGDGMQTGGIFVVGSDPKDLTRKKILYAFVESENNVDAFADTEAIVKACRDE